MKNQRHSKIDYMLLIITVLSLLVSFAVVTGAQNIDDIHSVSVTYAFSAPQTSKVSIETEIYDQVLLTDAPCTGDPGEPSLPVKGAYILLPAGTTVDKISVSGQKEFYGSGFHIVPCGEPIPIGLDTAGKIPTPDPIIYTSNSLFPGSLFTEVGVYQSRGYTIAVLELFPIQYIPASGEIYYYTEMTVTVTVKNDAQVNMLFRGSSLDEDEVLTKVDNPAVTDTYQTIHTESSTSDQYDLLIITTDTLKSGFEPLAAEHTATGVNTTIKTLTDIGGSTPEDIRAYVRDAYMNWGINYLLIGGDDDAVPARILWVYGLDENTTPYEDFMPADHYFGCLDGTYNYDGDGKWGEPTDGDNGGDVDLMAEVYVGRACVGNLDEVNNFVEKTLSFLTIENQRVQSIASMVGEYLGDYGVASFGGNYVDQFIDGSTADGYTTVGISSTDYQIDKLYDRDWPGFDPQDPWNTGWPPSEIQTRFNDGVLIINHLGHSNYEYNMRLDNNDVDSLSNDATCFIYSQGCMAGGFDNPEGYDCIAEHFTVKTPNAAFAGIWNARYGFFWSYKTDGDSQRYHRQFWDAIYGEDKPEIGRANHDSKEDNLFLIGRSCMRWVYYETNLFGDPTLTFRAPSPRPQLEIESTTGGFGRVSANILNNGSLPAESVDWSITVHGGILKRINITTMGTIQTLDVGNTTTISTDSFLFGLGKIEITVTIDYAEPTTATAMIIGPFVLGLS